MSKPLTQRLLTHSLAALCLLGLFGCDRAPSSSGGSAGPTPTSVTQTETSPAGPSSDFQIPALDLAKFPAPVRAMYEQLKTQFQANPKNPDLVVNLGAICYVHGDPRDAATFFRRGVSLLPDHEAGHYFLGLALEKAGQTDEAIKEYEEAIRYNEYSAPSHSRIGQLLMDKDPQRARQHFEAALKILPRDARAHYALGQLALQAGNAQEALDSLNEAIRIFPIYVDALRAAAEAARSLGREDEAAAFERRAAAGGRPPPIIDPLYGRLLDAGMDLPLMIQMAMQAAEQRDFERADERLLKAIAMDSGDGARIALASVRIRQGKLDEAATMARAALDANPESGPANILMAEVLLSQRKPQEAIPFLRKAIELDANDARAHFVLGSALRRAGDTPGAKAAFERVVAILPSYADAWEALVAIAMEKRDQAEIERVLRAGLSHAPNAAKLANGLAWILATSPDPARRNGAEAVKWAMSACELVQFRSHEFLDTLGAAFAEAGNFEDAVKAASDAVTIAREASPRSAAEKDVVDKLIAEYEQRRALYQQNKPYHETP